MKKNIAVIVCLVGISIYSHTINYQNQVLRHWNIKKEQQYVDGSFSMLKNGLVYIEDAENNTVKYPLSSFSIADQNYIQRKEAQVKAINLQTLSPNKVESDSLYYIKLSLIVFLLLLISGYFFSITDKKKIKYFVPIVSVGVLMTLFSFTKKILTTTDPNFVNTAFLPFVPNVATSWDNNYFYVESKGIPNHTMMVGISNHGWQQQVPIPQCYIGSSHWSIPLNPVIAASPIAIDNVHFTRGAIAIAANGVPIFNYHTNTGVDSYLDGQLDIYGGHCGRGDDYHYHIAPLHLYTLGQTTTNLPCAFSLDGFAVYGSVEPDGSSMTTLDSNHGHYGSNGVYHYHGTANAPYMIANFVGQVTEDATYQLIPQPAAHPVRNENWTPLNGALITTCVANGTNTGYNLSYTLNGTPGYATNYSWNGITYTFNYVTPTGTTTKTYNGFAQCTVPTLSAADFIEIEKRITVYPNPATDILNINLGNSNLENEVQNILIYDVKGSLIYRTSKFVSSIDIKKLSSGSYVVKIQFPKSVVAKKIVVK
jgi:hypothetical protein